MNHLHLQSATQPKSIAFYEKYFRFRKISELGKTAVLRNPENFILGIDAETASVSSPFHFGFCFKTKREVEMIYEQMKTEGIEFAQEIKDLSPRATNFYCLDPDGNKVEVGWYSAFFAVVLTLFTVPAFGAMRPVCERTEAVKVNLEQQTKKACADITEVDLAAIKRVAIPRRGVVEFKADDFSGLPNLEILNIKGNLFETLPEGMTKDLRNLKTIVLFGTPSLKFLPHDFLEGNELMENIHLFRVENLKTLSESVLVRLGNLKNLKVLDLDAKLEAPEQARINQMFANTNVELTFY